MACTAVPAVAQAHKGPGHGRDCARAQLKHGKAVARKACNRERKAIRKRASRALKPTVVAALKQCGSELVADPEAFIAKYANPGGREALERCVRFAVKGTAKPERPERPAKVLSPTAQALKDCAAEKVAGVDAFVAKYGGEDKREAFGNCVREHVGADASDEPGDDAAEKSDDADDSHESDEPDDQGDDSEDEPGDDDEHGPGDSLDPGEY